jgi:hypothetical protein
MCDGVSLGLVQEFSRFGAASFLPHFSPFFL